LNYKTIHADDEEDCKYATRCEADTVLHAGDSGVSRIDYMHCDGPEDCTCYDETNKPIDCATEAQMQVIKDGDKVKYDTSYEDIATFCKDDTDNQCAFWKHRKNLDATGSVDIYFIQDGGCKLPDDYGCEPDLCHGGGVDCDGDHAAEPTSDPNDPNDGCKTDGNYHPSEINNNWLHWYCTVDDDDKTPVNFVGDMEKMPLGTTCHTSHECIKFPDDTTAEAEAQYYTLTYECLKVSDKPTWTWQGDGLDTTIYDKYVITNDTEKRLVETTCNGMPLKMKTSTYNQDGLFITCTNEDITLSDDKASVSIPAENHCLMMCDNYPTIQFFADWKQYTDGTVKKGERVWFYKYYNSPDDATFELRTDDDCTAASDPTDCEANHVDKILKCWDTQVESKSWLADLFSGKFLKLFQ